MTAYQLYHHDGREAGVWVCATCNLIFSARHGGKDEAEACCVCKYCGEPAPRDDNNCYSKMHKACWTEHLKAAHAKRLESAEEVEAHDGWVYAEGWGPQDGYFASAEEAEDYIWDTHEDGCELPQWAFCCTSSPPPKLDIEDVAQRWEDNGYEGIGDDLSGVKELQKALDKFWEQNKHLVSWTPDYSRKVRLSFEDQQKYEGTVEHGG